MRRIELAVLMAACLTYGCIYAIYPAAASTVNTPAAAEPDPPAQDIDYSKFLHSNPSHSRLPCLLCHRRDDNSPRISFPGRSGHLPCAGCHTVEFSGNTSPMCTICHTDTGMKKFPGLKTFSARFDHGRHNGVNCSVCHKSANRGVALSIPSGGAAHTTCFSCHSATAAAEMSSCNVCHTPGRPNWTSAWARSFKLSFSHARHTQSGRLSCSNCHSVKAGASRGRQVTAPLASMHFAPANSLSCGGCHNGNRAFGPNDFSNCKRCHQGNSFSFRR